MKNTFKVLGIIALAVVISFSVTGCMEPSNTEPDITGGTTFTVTFNSNGGSAVAPITGITSGSTVTAPAAPTRTGVLQSKFGGWFKEAGLSNAWNFATDQVTGNITLHAKWDAYAVGDTGPGSGIIYYIDPTGFTVQMVNPAQNYIAHYLEAAPANASASTVQWGAYGTRITNVTTFTSALDADASLVGNGRKDTQLIVTHLATIPEINRAAQVCVEYRGPNNLTDWFLPSLGELNLLYTSGVSGITSGYYWSSSQYNNMYAWHLWFDYGTRINGYKNGSTNVSAVRAF